MSRLMMGLTMIAASLACSSTLSGSAVGSGSVVIPVAPSAPSPTPGTGGAAMNVETTPSPSLTDGPVHNGLSVRALLYNALTTNPKALDFLRKHPLNNSTFNDDNEDYPDMKYQLLDPHAQAVMSDLVRCALDSSSSVTYDATKFTQSQDAIRVTWHGELGLCSQGADNWPSKQCQERITSCLLARVNALHRSIPISLHAPGDIDIPLKKRIPVERSYRESNPFASMNEGTPIWSFTPDASLGDKNHHWQQGHVGICPRRSSITLTIQGSPSCDETSLGVRVCKGIYGCDENHVNVPPSALKYSGVAVFKKSGCGVTFDCPFLDSSEDLSQGSYGIMTWPTSRTVTAGGSPGTYPASEIDVFSFREGAFFGNLFEPTGLNAVREVTVEKKSGFVHITQTPTKSAGDRPIYACYSLGEEKDIEQNDDAAVSNFNNRVCAEPDSKSTSACFPNKPKRCGGKDNYQCSWDSQKQAYKDCVVGRKTYHTPITTYLDNPCSLLSQTQCEELSIVRKRAKFSPH